MLIVADIFLLGCLSFVAVQDLTKREISWLLIPFLFIAFFFRAVDTNKSVLWLDIKLNIGFITLVLVLLTLQLSIKNRKFVNIVNTYIGIGDILFFIAISNAFTLINFITFIVFSMFLIIVSVPLYNRFAEKKISTIPFAGIMAIVLMMLIITSRIVPQLNFYSDTYFLTVINNIYGFS